MSLANLLQRASKPAHFARPQDGAWVLSIEARNTVLSKLEMAADLCLVVAAIIQKPERTTPPKMLRRNQITEGAHRPSLTQSARSGALSHLHSAASPISTARSNVRLAASPFSIARLSPRIAANP